MTTPSQEGSPEIERAAIAALREPNPTDAYDRGWNNAIGAVLAAVVVSSPATPNGQEEWPSTVHCGNRQPHREHGPLEAFCVGGPWLGPAPSPASPAETAAKEYAMKCPSCESPSPTRHPAMQFEGEVQVCPDPFHASTEDGRKMLAQASPAETREGGPDAAWVSWRAGGMAETQVGVRSTAYKGGWCTPQGVVPDEWVIATSPIASPAAVPLPEEED